VKLYENQTTSISIIILLSEKKGCLSRQGEGKKSQGERGQGDRNKLAWGLKSGGSRSTLNFLVLGKKRNLAKRIGVSSGVIGVANGFGEVSCC